MCATSLYYRKKEKSIKKETLNLDKQNVEEENLLDEDKEIEENFSNYREGNNKWLHEYLVDGNQDSFVKLVEKNMKLVHYLTQKYYKSGYNLEEIESAASMGLVKAIQSFDVKKIGELTFATYASTVIRNEIFMEYRREKKY